MNLYTCNACRYTFPADTLSDRCPDCGKSTANVKVCIGGKNILRSVPAIRESTDIEAAEYERIKREIEAELAAEEEQILISSPSSSTSAFRFTFSKSTIRAHLKVRINRNSNSAPNSSTWLIPT